MSTLTTQPMNLVTAQKRAEKIVTWLAPYCERIQIAGSIRRERPLCNDIDIVCIPKFADRTIPPLDMFNPEKRRVNLLREFVCKYVKDEPDYTKEAWSGSLTAPHWKGRTGQPGPEPKEDASNLLLVTAARVQLDVWCATEATWFTRLICRTGSMQHNIWAAERAKANASAEQKDQGWGDVWTWVAIDPDTKP